MHYGGSFPLEEGFGQGLRGLWKKVEKNLKKLLTTEDDSVLMGGSFTLQGCTALKGAVHVVLGGGGGYIVH